MRRLKSSNERFEVKLCIMKLLSRIIGRHKLLIYPFYTIV
jgi:protein SDA1